MASIFTEILNGRSPGRFIWADDRVFAILTIEPRKPGHVLVIPRIEVDRWSDLDEELAMHIFRVGRLIGLAQRDEWDADRVGVMFEGYRVPHAHLHVWPSWTVYEYSHTGINRDPGTEALDEAFQRLRARMIDHGHGEFVPPLDWSIPQPDAAQ
ncbi:histidine triad (HIT) family protein [Salinibacterium amurskyense]|uniref:Histidine triad (HIT) family protein n=1 Tax=Salinibacterium amurskyense TaxID=205941 RepID=A0A2M9D578_9MICO|nr:HIT family protein [Salinibacterium amurskyense]PJJ80871.1 histidine triad (HIT) family protein [Salinibacterium amurskyense]RLQ82918.1 HIT family protein [Salinibacterium amurskyense]GHD82185.1 diadenosine tetraphosphate (Ap4A) hydrolase [Salinibacterium amurskyense]